MSNGIGDWLSNLMTYPLLIVCILIAGTSLGVFIGKRNALKKGTKSILLGVFILACVVLLFLAIMALTVGNNHPIASPMPIG